MFAVLVSGRLVQTQFQQVSPTKIVFPLDNATQVNTLAIFMTGSQPLPAGAGAIVYLGWPPFESWQYLGYLTNDMPSAFFKVSQADAAGAQSAAGGHFGPQAPGQNIVAQIGLEVAELAAIEHQFGRREARKERQVADFVMFSQSLMEGLFNFVGSFTFEIRNDATGQPEKIVPMRIFERWYSSFLGKLKSNPDFWRLQR